MMAFLLVNVFFGIVGTFWLRTERRRSEIGLRMAIGSSRGRLGEYMYLEGLGLLAITVPILLVFVFNMAFLDKLDSYREPLSILPLSSNPQRLLPPDGRHDLHGNLVPCPQGGKDGSGGGVALRINCLSLRLSIH